MKFKRTVSIDKIMNMKKRVKVIQGGTSAGKTYSILPILIDKAIKNPNIVVTVVSRTLPHLRVGAMRDFLNIMKDLKRYDDKQWNRSNFIYSFKNGSIIEFQNADEDKARGPRRNILYINEANKGISFEIYNQYAMRTANDIYIDFNPDNLFWAHTEVLDDQTDSELLILTYRDNVDVETGISTLPQTIIDGLIQRIKRAEKSEYWRNWVRVYIEGEIGKLEGAIYEDWSIFDGNLNDKELIGYGMDIGFHPDPTAIVALYRGESNFEIIVDELVYKNNMVTSDIYNQLKRLDRNKVIWSDRDSRLIEELRRKGINIKGATKGKNSVRDGIFFIQDYNLKITKNSKNLIDELQRYVWDDNKKDTPINDYDHLMDAMRYGITMSLGRDSIKDYDGVNL